jgi:ribosomal protein S18 acetylase RimI-like enzyme
MSPILTDLSPPALTAAIEANLCALGRVLGQAPRTVLHDAPGLLSYLTGIPHPIFNGVLRTDLKIEEADRVVDETLARFQARGVPMRWVTGPSSQPSDLGGRLLARGLIQADRPGVGTEDLGMAADLRALHEPWSAPSDLTIQPVTEAMSGRRWAEAARRGFGLSPEVAEGWLHLHDSLPRQGPLHHFVGMRGGEPVATASLLLDRGAAGIYNLSTAPDHRRQGIGTAMLLEACRAARTVGYRVGVLVAAPVGVSLYRRIGFTEYCLFSVYYWLGAPRSAAADVSIQARAEAGRRLNGSLTAA